MFRGPNGTFPFGNPSVRHYAGSVVSALLPFGSRSLRHHAGAVASGLFPFGQ